MKKLIVCLAAAGFMNTAIANERPSSEAIKDVVNYYFQDESAEPILADMKICSEIHKSGAEKYNCSGELDKNNLPKGENVYVWMNYLVPKGQKAQLLMQVNHSGITRSTHNFEVAGGIRYRVWKQIRLNKSGEWNLPILLDSETGITELTTLDIQVIDHAVASIN